MEPAPVPVPIETLLAQREWVRWLARTLAADESRADDLEQETWLAAVERPPTSDRSIRGWLATVLRRAASKGRRSAARSERRERAAARPEGQPSAAAVVAEAELHSRVVRAVLDLDEPYRTALLLRYFENLPPRDVAARTGVPVETARSRAQRGVALLRERFDREHGGDRKAWLAALAPLAAAPSGAVPAGSASATPFLAKALAAAAVVVAAAGSAAWWLSRDAGSVAETTTARSTGVETGSASAEPAGGSAPSRSTVAPIPDAPSVESGSGATLAAKPAGAAAPAGARAEAALSGRVTRGASDGLPVAGARVVAIRLPPWRGPSTEASWVTTTDSDGRYAFAILPPGEMMPRVEMALASQATTLVFLESALPVEAVLTWTVHATSSVVTVPNW